jgi:hypothetical protein
MKFAWKNAAARCRRSALSRHNSSTASRIGSSPSLLVCAKRNEISYRKLFSPTPSECLPTPAHIDGVRSIVLEWKKARKERTEIKPDGKPTCDVLKLPSTLNFFFVFYNFFLACMSTRKSSAHVTKQKKN